jgi:hypothetical protein
MFLVPIVEPYAGGLVGALAFDVLVRPFLPPDASKDR